MSLSKLPKDCLYHLMTFIPSPIERKKLVFALRTTEAQQAFKEPSLWLKWQNFDITDSLFLNQPKAITIVLDNVKKIERLAIKLSTDNNFVPMKQIIQCIENSTNKYWDAKELEIVVEHFAYTDSTFFNLMLLLFKRLGKTVSTVKLHINERPVSTNDSCLQMFFASVIDEQKFNRTTLLDLNTFGQNVGNKFAEVLNRLPLKYLKIVDLHILLPSCLSNTIEQLEELCVIYCDSMLSDNLIQKFAPKSFTEMKEVSFTCKSLDDAIKWNELCRLFFEHCSFEIIITKPMGETKQKQENIELIEHEYFVQMKDIVQNFIEAELKTSMSTSNRHNLTIGQKFRPKDIFCYHVVQLLYWIEEFRFEEERTANYVTFKVKENSTINIFCSPQKLM